MLLISLVTILTNVAPVQAAPSVRSAALCAGYLEQAEPLRRALPPSARSYLDTVIDKVVTNARQARAALPPAPVWRRFGDFLKGMSVEHERFVVNLAEPIVDRADGFRREASALNLVFVRETISTAADVVTPLRHVIKGRAAVGEFLTGAKTRALAFERELEDHYGVRRAELENDRAELARGRAFDLAALKEKVRAEGAESWRNTIFGPSSDLSNPARLLVLASYAKKAAAVSLLAGLINPALVPLSAVTFGVGWWGVRQWIYLGVERAQVFVSSWLEDRDLKKTSERVDRMRAEFAGVAHHLADLDTLIALSQREDVPQAVASFTHDVRVPMTGQRGELSEVLNASRIGEGLRQTSDRYRWATLTQVLHFGEDGEPELAVVLSERGSPARLRAWASTLIVSPFSK